MSGKDKKTQSKTKRVVSIVLNVVLYVFFALCLLALVFTIIGKRDTDGAISVFGKQMRLVVSGSMEKNEKTYDSISKYKIKDIPVRSMIFIELVPDDNGKAEEWYSKLQVGDVLTFRWKRSETSQITVTHRIVSIEQSRSGGYTIRLRGDNTDDPDGVGEQVVDTGQVGSTSYVIGKVIGKSVVLGNITYILKQPIGLVCIIIIPCAIIIIWQIMRIVTALGADKKAKIVEQTEQQSAEIEELKRQLASLQQAVDTNDGEKDGKKGESSSLGADKRLEDNSDDQE